MVHKDKNISRSNQPRLIEIDTFPFEFLSAIAEKESWRKEIYRPVYHVHKWWAKRLGSIFRGIILGCLLPEDGCLEEPFYRKQNFSRVSIFDPFMGSGTTVGEAHKLGCIALGRDINSVACESVRVALGPLDRNQLQKAFLQLAATVGVRIRDLYQSMDEHGGHCDVLYYFWVKQILCPQCGAGVDLFPSRVIARNAYPDRKPEIQVCCPRCGDLFTALHYDKHVHCPSCELDFDPHVGLASGTKATCSVCAHTFSIANAVRTFGKPPVHRLYGKLLLTAEGTKRYLPATPADIQSYDECSRLLEDQLRQGAIRLPDTVLMDGFNTRQALGYNYCNWRDFFNDRQLLALGWLQKAIADLADVPTRDALLLLFSGVLEFNNLFASYKGEGTGAVRHMFAHHILKPERTPIEANIWGTPKSSGSFSNLFKTRLMRAVAYRNAPSEVACNSSTRHQVVSPPFSGCLEKTWPPLGDFKPRGIYLSCGSSDETGLPDGCVDFIVTDPPFFDNVHYSELADFFHAWQRLHPRGFINDASTTRHRHEVQDTDANEFAAKLFAVFSECHRVLKDHGLLVFTYHHSRAEGWISLLKAVVEAGFSVVNAHPVRSEMSVAVPKSQTKEPIQLDVILVCKKREHDSRKVLESFQALAEAAQQSIKKLCRLTEIGLKLSRNDRRIVIISQFIAATGPVASAAKSIDALLQQQSKLEEIAEQVLVGTSTMVDSGSMLEAVDERQMEFSF
ncbi:MAG: hypothetical protein U1F76_18960 [Candidatus Competibacteraceae bacterium]